MDYLEIAQRIIDLDSYGARNAEETAETVAEEIQQDPIAVIEYLLTIIEEIID